MRALAINARGCDGLVVYCAARHSWKWQANGTVVDTGKIKAVLSMLRRRGLIGSYCLPYITHIRRKPFRVCFAVRHWCRHAVMIVNYGDVIPLTKHGKRSIEIKIAAGIERTEININICPPPLHRGASSNPNLHRWFIK